MAEELKTVVKSRVIKTELVMPNDTNVMGTLFGGKLMAWMDIAAAISAQRHSDAPVVTASIDNVSFKKPIKIGDTVTITAHVTRAFNTSMEVFVEVIKEEHIFKKIKHQTNTAFFILVAVDVNGTPIKILPIIPETELEIEMYNESLKRRELRIQSYKKT